MTNFNIAVLGAPGYSEGLGKKGTSTDVTFYNMKRGEATLTFIEPSRYPERLSSLFYASSTASVAIVVVDGITPTFGETIVMLQCLNIAKGFLVLRNFISREKVLPLIKGTVAEKYEIIDDDRNALRERLLKEAEAPRQGPDPELKGTVVVDHSFNVKGVGTVVLGTVVKGTVKAHEALRALPGEKNAQIRSIQKHDDDFDVASEGDRVGLALKDINVEDVERGTVLTTEPYAVSSSLAGKAELVRYWGSPLKIGMVLHIGHWMQFISARVESLDEAEGGNWRTPTIKLKLESPLTYSPGDRAVLMYLEGGKLRVVGSMQIQPDSSPQ